MTSKEGGKISEAINEVRAAAAALDRAKAKVKRSRLAFDKACEGEDAARNRFIGARGHVMILAIGDSKTEEA